MKKIKILLPAFFLYIIFAFTGCNNAKLTEIENAATAFLQAADEADIEAVLENCTKNALTQMNLSSLDPLFSSNSFFLGTGFDKSSFSKEAIAATEEYGKYLADSLIQGYTIHAVSEKNDIGYVTVTITTSAYDSSQPFMSTTFQDEMATIMTDYTNAHIDELSVIYIKQGKEALALYILDKCVPKIMELMKKEVDTYVLQDIKFKLQLEMIENKWMITGAIKEE